MDRWTARLCRARERAFGVAICFLQAAAAAVLLGLGLALSGLPALAGSYPDLTVFENAAVVPDAELAEMRGRFVEGGQVTYFGFQMFTVWQTVDGVLLTAGLEWSADASGNVGTPQAAFYYSAPENPAPGSPPGTPVIITNPVADGAVVTVPLPATANAGGLETARGVVQSVHAAGDINSIGNDIAFNVTDGAVIVTTGTPASPIGVPFDLTETTTVQFAPGTKATAFLESNAIGVVVKINNLGTVVQEIRGGVGRAAQHVNLRSDLNLVRNTLNINFGRAPGSAGLRANLSTALNLMQGLR